MYFMQSSARHDLTLTTNPLGCSPLIPVQEHAGDNLAHYPSKENIALKAALAEKTGLTPANIILGAGIDGLLFAIFGSCLLAGSTVVAPEVTFPKVATIVSRFGSTLRFVKMKQGLETDFDAMKSAAGSASITYLANPNNPTGIVEKQSEIRRLCEAARGSVVVDEANGEFDDSESCLGLIHDIPNLIVLRTFSKAYGLACLRVGYCAANEQIIAQLEARSPRFPVSGLSARIALIGLNDDNHIQRTVEHVGTQTKMLVAALRSRGIWCSASTANCFVMHLPPQLGSGPDFLAFCAENGISLVPGEEFGLSKNHFRVAPQLNEGSAALIAAIDTFVHTRIQDSS
jgi:histidinol-phosphate aminotransferase